MIYVTGDIHGDEERLRKAAFRLKKGDFLLVCGDFGFVWDGGKKEKRRLKRWGKKKYHILFADGVHENFTALNECEQVDFAGGKALRVSGNLMYLIRGEVYSLGGKKVLVFGGGYDSEMGYRSDPDIFPEINDMASDLRKGEIGNVPGKEDIENAIRNLAAHNYKVDYVVSYEAPSKIASFLNLKHPGDAHSNAYLDEIAKKTEFDRWFFGAYHLNKLVTSQFVAMFDKIVSAEEISYMKSPKNKRKNKGE
ncbi:hypothetical protein FACS189499_02550 [Clostridia bacterium]|nr:hypothetical protein FACS189499_02550 [Clostridia bacterium]